MMYFSLKMWIQQKWMRSIGKWNISNGKLITINVQIRGVFWGRGGLYIWAQLLYLHDLFPSLVCLLFPVGFAWILQSKLARRSQWIGPTLASKRFLPMQLNNLNECQKKKLPTTNSFGRALFGPRPFPVFFSSILSQGTLVQNHTLHSEDWNVWLTKPGIILKANSTLCYYLQCSLSKRCKSGKKNKSVESTASMCLSM